MYRKKFIQLAGMAGAGLILPRRFYKKSRVAETAAINIQLNGKSTPIAAEIYGQFIEHLGRCIDGGIYEEGSALSDKQGFRKDVLTKVKGLNTPLIRFPGGTYTKIYHWKDGIGNINARHARPNLIWGGVNNNHFGTDEMLSYAKHIGAEPYFAINMSTGSPEEASDWVEYCNGTGNTYYADMRRKNGHSDAYNVKYWGLGNEERAQGDAGNLQNPEDFVKAAWMYAKLMKLQDRDIQFVISGADEKWNEYVLKNMHPVCNYISLHSYSNTEAGKPASLFSKVDHLETEIGALKQQIETFAPAQVTDFDKWYRFPPRTKPVKIAIDELGIWEKGEGVYNLECTYNWNHALATATLYNIMQRQSGIVGMANWAQTVNVLAPIMTSHQASVCQTIYYPMQFYRQLAGNSSVVADTDCPDLKLPGAEDRKMLDVSVTLHDQTGKLTIFVINRHPESSVKTSLHINGEIKFSRLTVHELNAASTESANHIGHPAENVVKRTEQSQHADIESYIFPAHSITALVYS